ncbi:MAG: 50S ribosomal protein L14e [Zestosphaera sp.]
MAAIEVGRVCVKIRGREAGRKCVIVDIIDENFVYVTGPKSLSGVKRRKTNVNHIEPTDKKVDISKGASDEEVLQALKSNGLEDFMKEKVRVSAKELLYTKTLMTVPK